MKLQLFNAASYVALCMWPLIAFADPVTGVDSAEATEGLKSMCGKMPGYTSTSILPIPRELAPLI